VAAPPAEFQCPAGRCRRRAAPWRAAGARRSGRRSGRFRPVRLAYRPPASSTFLSEQTSHQPALLFSQNNPAPAISHQPTARVRLVGDGHTLEHAAPPQELARTARGDAGQAQARAVWWVKIKNGAMPCKRKPGRCGG
jgi:hypothetical protein